MKIRSLLLIASLGLQANEPLPLPRTDIPDAPPLAPMVITAGGQKLLLEHVPDLQVWWVEESRILRNNRPGWWITNFPLERVANRGDLSPDDLARKLFGRPARDVKNWWTNQPGDRKFAVAGEPSAPTGPAAFKPHPHPAHIVDPAGGPGVHTRIQSAINLARPGEVIQVRPGIYRETLRPRAAGEADKPIVIEGLRDEKGELPVVSGNDAAPRGAWKSVEGHPGLWRAEPWTPGPGELAFDGKKLPERTLISELREFEFVQNRGDRALLAPSRGPQDNPRPGESALDGAWRAFETDAEGFLNFGETRGLVYASSWVWMEPERGVEWDPRFPAPVTGRVWMGGGYRAGRQSGSPFRHQLNPYRLWINGEIMPAAGNSTGPRADTKQGDGGDSWSRLPFKSGWNHVMILFDGTFRADLPQRYRFRTPRGRPDMVSRGTRPDDLTAPPAADEARHGWIRSWTVLGPLPGRHPDRAVYLRLPEGVDPDDHTVDMGAREMLAHLNQPFWTVRGLEFRHGAQGQQKAQVLVEAPGVVIEHSRFLEPEVRALSFYVHAQFEPDSAPVTARGNWIHDPGSLGMGATASSASLSADNVNRPPRRGRLLIEHNHILNNSLSGYDRFDESGAMKFFRLTGSVIRHNTIVGGEGPGVWLDWEHYNNRIDGNLFLQPVAFAVGVEASPGPNLVANNVSIDLRPGGEWFRYALLSWNSAGTWALHNTVDNGLAQPADGYGIYLGEGGNSGRGHRWEPLPQRDAAAVNNLILRTSNPLVRRHIETEAGNWIHPDSPPAFAHAAAGDYRHAGGAPPEPGVKMARVSHAGEELEIIRFVRHDFFGLPRHAEDPRPAGAFRQERDAPLHLEAEFSDGTFFRR